MGKIAAVHIHFTSRNELRYLDEAARRFGGIRATTEFRPCYRYVTMAEKPHSATYLFTTEELVQAFVREQGAL
jgi:hypothetical protein